MNRYLQYWNVYHFIAITIAIHDTCILLDIWSGLWIFHMFRQAWKWQRHGKMHRKYLQYNISLMMRWLQVKFIFPSSLFMHRANVCLLISAVSCAVSWFMIKWYVVVHKPGFFFHCQSNWNQTESKSNTHCTHIIRTFVQAIFFLQTDENLIYQIDAKIKSIFQARKLFRCAHLQMFNAHIMHTCDKLSYIECWTLNVIYVSSGYENLHFSVELDIIIM